MAGKRNFTTEEENKGIFTAFEIMLKDTQRGYVVSWLLARALGMDTQRVNYYLHKKVKEGLIHFATLQSSTLFYPVGTDLDPIWTKRDIKRSSDPKFN